MLSGEPRLATPYALRDTELIRFSPESFHALIDRYPKALKTLMRTLIEKSIVTPHASTQRRASTRYFTLVPTGPSAPAAAFAQGSARSSRGPGRRSISAPRRFPPSASCTMWLVCPRATRGGCGSAFGWRTRVRARRSLVLVHPQATRLPSGTQVWLSRRQLDSYHHVRLGNPADLARLASILSGRPSG